MTGPFQTQNTALALTLTTCGAEIPTDEAGHPVPCVHLYDRETLARLGYKGWTLEDAAKDAAAKGRPGIVIYQFVRNELLDRLIDAFDKQKKAILEAGGSEAIDVDPEIAARIIGQALHNRKGLINAWKAVPITIAVHGTSKAFTDKQGRKITEGSMKIYTTGIDQKTRKRLGV